MGSYWCKKNDEETENSTTHNGEFHRYIESSLDNFTDTIAIPPCVPTKHILKKYVDGAISEFETTYDVKELDVNMNSHLSYLHSTTCTLKNASNHKKCIGNNGFEKAKIDIWTHYYAKKKENHLIKEGEIDNIDKDIADERSKKAKSRKNIHKDMTSTDKTDYRKKIEDAFQGFLCTSKNKKTSCREAYANKLLIEKKIKKRRIEIITELYTKNYLNNLNINYKKAVDRIYAAHKERKDTLTHEDRTNNKLYEEWYNQNY